MRSTVVSVLTLCALTLCAFAPAASAQAEAAPRGGSQARKTVIDFDDDTIEGQLKAPDGRYLAVAKRSPHKSLIRSRVDFRREVLSSVGGL